MKQHPPAKKCLMNLVVAIVIFIWCFQIPLHAQVSPDQLSFVRQGVQRLIFNPDQSIPLAGLYPGTIIGLPVMHPIIHYSGEQAALSIQGKQLHIQSEGESQTGIWFGGFNPFATYTIDLASCGGEGAFGFEFSSPDRKDQFVVTAGFKDSLLTGIQVKIRKGNELVLDELAEINLSGKEKIKSRFILQMLGSGFVLYQEDLGLPRIIGQSDFSNYLDLRKKDFIHTFQSKLYLHLYDAELAISRVEMALSTGVGQADSRAITYENGDPLLDQGRLWYTMSIRGRALPHHLQGVFSMNPGVFDLKFEGIIVFDRKDGLLRNEIASHVFYDRRNKAWRGLTTGFSAYASPDEEKQLLAIESNTDPRFGFSVMRAEPFGMVGDIEDPHILYDGEAEKWRMLTCENQQGYKAILLESDHWNKGYQKIAGPVEHNSTGTSMQKIGDQIYCFSGSSEREIFIYTYPDLKEAGTLNMDLPPWGENSGTRVWPNVVQLPEGYPNKYIALMMDRFNYPGMSGPHWSYGALYLYHGRVQ
jgi:hypothetical protein